MREVGLFINIGGNGNCGCDTIKVTYQLVGEEPVTVEVGVEEQFNGKNAYVFNIGISLFAIYWNNELIEWQLWNIYNFEASLSEDTPCPFGNFTIEEGSIFESFEVEPITNTLPSWSYEPLNVLNETSRQKTSKRDQLIQEQVTAKRTFDYKSQIL